MKRFIFLFCLTLITSGLLAQETATVSMNPSLGYPTSGTTTSWTGSDSKVPGIVFSGSGINITSSKFRLIYVRAATAIYTITAPDGWRITGYNIGFYVGTNASRQAYGNPGTSVSTTDYTVATTTSNTAANPAVMTVTELNDVSTQFSVLKTYGSASTMYGPYVSNFTVNLIQDGIASGLTWSAPSATVQKDGTPTFPMLSNPNDVSVSYKSSNTGVATIDENTGEISIVGTGETVITATSSHEKVGSQWYLGCSVSYTLTVVGAAKPGLAWSKTSVTARYPDTSLLPTLTKPAGLAVTYASDNPTVATIAADGAITLVGTGKATLTATSAEQTIGGQEYLAAKAECRLSVIEVSDGTWTASNTGEFFPSLSNMTSKDILDVFYKAIKAGRNYPSDADWIAAGFNPDDIAFVRSHVRKRNVIRSSSADRTIANSSYWSSKRNIFANLPNGVEKYGANGYPSANFAEDNYSMWNYTELFGSWNHSVGQTPGSWVDAAHKNGTAISSGSIFFDTSSGYSSYTSTIRATDNTEPSGFKYARAIAAMLIYFGHDGVSYNWEYSDSSPGEEDQRKFMKAIFDEAKSRGYLQNLRMNIYTNNSSYGSGYAEYGTKGDGYVADIMLDYSNPEGSITSTSNQISSYNTYKNQVGDEYADRIYAGTRISTWNRGFTSLSGHHCGLCIWGEHSASRMWTSNEGSTPKEFMNNYLTIQERAFSGGNQNPNNTDNLGFNLGTDSDYGGKLSRFGGLAQFVAERSTVIGNLPFLTNFQIGNGQLYNYKGRQTAGSWYNMANQDIVPTYRWLVVDDVSASTKVTNTSIQPRFSYDDAYTGGSMLEITGCGTTAGDIVLYKTDLVVAGANPVAKVAVKTPAAAGSTNLQLKLQIDNTWRTFDIGSTSGTTWEEKTIRLDGVSVGANIQNIVLRVASVSEGAKFYVGKLEINDDATIKPVGVDKLQIKVFNEKQTAMTIKAWWEVQQEPNAYGLLYNDELNVDHFEVLYKSSENGKVSEVGRTTQWAALIPDILIDPADDPWIGVRSVSTDLKTYSEIVWYHVGHNLSSETSQYGDGYGFPTLGSYGYQNDDAGQRAYIKMLNAYTEGASVQNLEYDIKSNVPDPYVGSTGCPALDLGLFKSILVDICAYDIADDLCIKANPGDNITFTFMVNDSYSGRSLTYGLLSVFADWYRLGYFADDPIYSVGERESKQNFSPYAVSGIGTSMCTLQFSFRVPDDAAPGKSRLRLVFNDSWSMQPGAASSITKGIAYDFPIEVMNVGQDVGTSEFLNGKDQGESVAPDGTPGAMATSWTDLRDGGAYRLVAVNSDNALVNVNQTNGADAGRDLSELGGLGFDDGDNRINTVGYGSNAKYILHRDGNQLVLVNGYGRYHGHTDNALAHETTYSAEQNKYTISDGRYIDGYKTFKLSNGNDFDSTTYMLKETAYPNVVNFLPISSSNISVPDYNGNYGITVFSAPFETLLPENVRAYSVTTVNDSKDLATLVPISATDANGNDVLPKNTGALLIYMPGMETIPEKGVSMLMVPAFDSDAPSIDNTLTQAFTVERTELADEPLSASGLYYVLSSKGNAETRKLYKLAVSKPSNRILKPNKAYIDVSGMSLSGRALSIVFDSSSTTAIGHVKESVATEKEMYDLQGRHISQEGFKGIYIQNGKKIVKF